MTLLKRTLKALAVLALLPAAVAPALAALPAVVGEMQVPSLSPMIKKVRPAVVNIATRGTIHE